MSSGVGELQVPAASYEIGGRVFGTTSTELADAIVSALRTLQRPRCMCVPDGVEMYVARRPGSTEAFVIKRMPNTGSRHATHCRSYEPPPEMSGLGEVVGSAIVEDPASGETVLKLDFPLSKWPGRSTSPAAARVATSVHSDGTGLSLRGLLHYLWAEAELNRWHPNFEGRRSWAIVRSHLLRAAANKVIRGTPLPSPCTSRRYSRLRSVTRSTPVDLDNGLMRARHLEGRSR